MASSWGREFVAGGVGGMAGVVAGHPFDTLRIRMQQPNCRRPSATALFRSILRSEGPAALYRGMAAPFASVAFQNAMVFQIYAMLSSEPASYANAALAGFGTGALQSALLSPVELVKIRLQLQSASNSEGPLSLAKRILRTEGVRGIYRGFSVTVLRDAPAHGVYFWAYEFARERIRADQSLGGMLVAGGLAGVASWACCYPLDVVKSRLQAQAGMPSAYHGIADCFRKSVRAEGYSVLWRGFGTAVARAFVVNGAIFSAYELALSLMASH